MYSCLVEYVFDEVCGFVVCGYKEIVFIGVYFGYYGVDLNWGKLKLDWLWFVNLLW